MVFQRRKLTVTVKRGLLAKDLVLADFVVKSIFMHNTETFRRYSDIYRAKQKSYGKFVVNYCLEPSHPSFFWLATLDREVCCQLLGIAMEYIDAINEAADAGVSQMLSQVGEHNFSALQTAVLSAQGTRSDEKRAFAEDNVGSFVGENQIFEHQMRGQVMHSENDSALAVQREKHVPEPSFIDTGIAGGDNPALSRIPLI